MDLENSITELRSLFATFKSLKPVEFPMYAVVRKSSSNYIAVTIRLKLYYSCIL